MGKMISCFLFKLTIYVLMILQATAAYSQESPPETQNHRRVAVTFDDLPGVALPEGFRCNFDSLKWVSQRLLQTAKAHQMPVAGFVVESRNCETFGKSELQVIYDLWLNAGATLGNHTHSHIDLNRTPVAEYQTDILRGETVLQPMLEKYGQQSKFFRYPYLHAGNTDTSKSAIEAFLADHNYQNAPVTIDNQEWVFAAVYARAKNRGDGATMQKIADA